LSDNQTYIINIIDLSPAGLLVKAYSQESAQEYTLSPTEEQLKEAGLLGRSDEDLQTLAESLDITRKGDGERMILSSSLEAIKDQKIIPQGPEEVNAYLNSIQWPSTANGSSGEVLALPELLTTALSELCAVKPTAGIDAVRWLGEWLVENNPSQPHVEELE
jgi:hypothetical protein